MSNINLYETDFITVEYIPDKRMIYHVIHKPIGGQLQMLKDGLNAGTDAMGKYKICKWLSDDRKNDPLPHELIEWGNAEWNPRTIKAGWKYWANVVPEDMAAAGTLMPVIESLFKFGLRMQVFTNVETAIKWLDNMKEPEA